VLYSFVYTRVAVLVRHWFEIGLTDGVLEHGARLELRLLEPQPHRGTESAAQRFVIDRPVWRADLFDRLDRPAGTFSAAHFHPRFEGDEPSDRVFRDEITADPWAWTVAQLSALDAVAAAAGLPPDAVAADAPDVREQAALITDTARSLEASRCASRERCFRWTRDVAGTVRIMAAGMADPALLDRAAAAPWLETG
jgi:hypothetical protein